MDFFGFFSPLPVLKQLQTLKHSCGNRMRQACSWAQVFNAHKSGRLSIGCLMGEDSSVRPCYALNLQMLPEGPCVKGLLASWWTFVRWMDHQVSNFISRSIHWCIHSQKD
jgi:hypothetical protein